MGCTIPAHHFDQAGNGRRPKVEGVVLATYWLVSGANLPAPERAEVPERSGGERNRIEPLVGAFSLLIGDLNIEHRTLSLEL
jgi:hypothetical protein